MNLLDVALFSSIVSSGSLSGAGRQTGMSPMAVSRRLAALEQELGVRLVHRTTRSVSLTTDGETFLPLARAMLDAKDAALAAFGDQHESLSGILKVTAPNLIGRTLVTPLAANLMATNPRLNVDLTLSDKLVDIVSSGIDVAIRVAPLQASELIAVKLVDNPRILCAAPAYIEAHGAPERLADLEQHACLTLHGVGAWLFERDGASFAKTIEGRLTANSIDTVRAACLAGAGLAMLTYWDVTDDLASGALARIHLNDAENDMLGIWAVLPTRNQMPARVRAFVDTLKSGFNAHRPV